MTDPRLVAVLDDLRVEDDRIDAVLAPLDEEQWRLPTKAVGWDIATTVSHLAWTDEIAVAASYDDEAWQHTLADASRDPVGFVDGQALAGAAAPGAELLQRWRQSRRALRRRFLGLDADQRIPWFGPPMNPVSLASARYMETWAHGLDISEGLGMQAEPHDRVRHVAHLGVRARGYSFMVNGLDAPSEDIGVRLRLLSGEEWAAGPDDAAQSVTGPLWDFALLVTQRRHRDDLALVAEGQDADRWLDIAQAFAGPPGTGRPPSGKDHA